MYGTELCLTSELSFDEGFVGSTIVLVVATCVYNINSLSLSLSLSLSIYIYIYIYIYININTGCSLEDLMGVMDDRDGRRESQENPCCHHNLYIFCLCFIP